MNLQLFSKIKIRTNFNLIFVFFIVFLFSNYVVLSQEKEFVVVLDAGHGGWEPGKVGLKKIKEKDITLKIVLELGKLLEKEENIKVVYTRKKDVYIGLKERGHIANKVDADLFVSIHCNSWTTNQPNGFETYVLGLHANKQNFEVAKAENSVILLEDNYKEKYKGFDPNSPESFIGLTLMQEEYLDQSIQLASIVQDNLVKDLGSKDRGVKQAGFMVLHQSYMPSILIESGFLTNSRDMALLNSESGQMKISNAIFKGVKTYIQQLTLNSVPDEKVVVNETENEPEKATENVTEAKNENEPVKVTENSVKDVYTGIEFKVQIASGSRKLETKSYNFKGLKNVERIKVGASYKYYLGNESSFSEIKKTQKLAISKGYTTAFVVAFKNGVKIPMPTILEKS